jgi:hypothetical protein
VSEVGCSSFGTVAEERERVEDRGTRRATQGSRCREGGVNSPRVPRAEAAPTGERFGSLPVLGTAEWWRVAETCPSLSCFLRRHFVFQSGASFFAWLDVRSSHDVTSLTPLLLRKKGVGVLVAEPLLGRGPTNEWSSQASARRLRNRFQYDS